VGAFDGNAFAAPYGENRIAVCLPVEEGINRITMVHELIHLVHGKITGFTAGWEIPVASLVMQEGLAMQLSKHLVPNHKDEDYVADQNGWFRSCCMDEQQILQGIKPYLKECSGERIFQFTMGTGTTGKVREGYFAGWKLIGTMLENGMTFAEIARIKAEYEARNKEIERQHRLEMAKIIGGGLLSIGSAFIPGTAGIKVAGALGKTIAPMVGKKIGTEIASGLVSGGLSGAVEGFGRGLIENKNPLKRVGFILLIRLNSILFCCSY
jgi:hypothetical protein